MTVEILAIEADPFAPIRQARERLSRPWQDIPLRALGGNVLLRELKLDLSWLLVEHSAKNKTPYRIGEVISLGSRWNQSAVWHPPMPTPKKGVMLDGEGEKEWKAPELHINRWRPPPPDFNEAHASLLEDVKPGDLVVYINSRAYDFFTWETDDLIVYPGNWIQGVLRDTFLADNPDARRFDRQEV